MWSARTRKHGDLVLIEKDEPLPLSERADAA